MASIVNFVVEAYFAGTPDITLVIWVNNDNDSNFLFAFLCCDLVFVFDHLVLRNSPFGCLNSFWSGDSVFDFYENMVSYTIKTIESYP